MATAILSPRQFDLRRYSFAVTFAHQNGCQTRLHSLMLKCLNEPEADAVNAAAFTALAACTQAALSRAAPSEERPEAQPDHISSEACDQCM